MKVAICGDGFRFHERNDRADYLLNVDILARLISPALRRHDCDIHVIKQFRVDHRTNVHLQRTIGIGQDVYSWAYRSQVLTNSLRDFYELSFADYDLIVGFEIPLSLLQHCSEVGVKAIDIALHPYRFLDDLVLMARSSDPRIDAAIEGIECVLSNEVLLPPLRAEAISKNREIASLIRLSAGETTPIFLLQTRFDRSKFDGEGGFIDDLLVLCSSNIGAKYYKPHPYEARPELELHLIRRGAKRLPQSVSFYELLSAAGTHLEILAVTSGALSEAEALGARSVKGRGHSPWEGAGIRVPKPKTNGAAYCRYRPVDMRVLTDRFWAGVLGSAALPGTPIGFKSGFLRSAFGMSWDYRVP